MGDQDKTEEVLEEYVANNFEVLPLDVLKLILSQMDRDALLNFCRTNKKFSGFCRSQKFRSLLDVKDLKYLSEQTPLAAPIRTLQDQVDLVKRGFRVTYKCDFDTTTRVATISFGHYDEPGNEMNECFFNFSIVGLPPARGTKVWLFLDTERGMDREARPYAEVFVTQQEALMSENERPLLILRETSEYDAEFRRELALLKDTGHSGDFHLFEVALP